jgi:hypothetical protein
VRKRRNNNPGLVLRVASTGGAVAFWLWAKAARRPVDSSAILIAVAASLMIIVNAMFLQSGTHSAPFFANPPPAAAAIGPNGSLPQQVAPATRGAHPAAARPNDPIGDLIALTSRIAAVQRALSDYGYGQLRPSGILDEPTSAAIEKFEREHNMTVTGRVSDRLMTELAAMIGHPLE